MDSHGATTAEAAPVAATLALTSSRRDGLYWQGEDVVLTIGLSEPLPEGPLDLAFSRTDLDGTVWLDGSCITTGTDPANLCWNAEKVPWTSLAEAEATLDLPAFHADAASTREVRFDAEILFVDDAGDEVVLTQGALAQIYLGRSLIWGDPHAHSNLSMDGCEDALNDCADRGTGPASDFFPSAVALGLDFAALTDHAEFVSRYSPTSADDDDDDDDEHDDAYGPAMDLWQRTQDIVAQAEGTDFIPILGYLDDLLIVPAGIALAIHLIPAALMVEYRAEAQRRSDRPRSVAAAFAITLVWIAAIAVTILLLAPPLI